ncbi:MAG: hypothetical protein ACRC7G_02550 [Beijerinckiaceae bacterium]
MGSPVKHTALFSIAGLFCACLPGSSALAQMSFVPGEHEARLSGWCRSISSTDNAASQPGDYRVRKGGKLSVSGNRQTVFVDSGGTVEVSGTASTIYVARGGSAKVAGERIQIFAEDGANLQLQGQMILTSVERLVPSIHRNAPECR